MGRVAIRRTRRPNQKTPNPELARGAAVATVSFGGGIPAKIDSAARLVDPRSDVGDYFLFYSDLFHGSSGGAGLDDRGSLIGVVGRGAPDFSRDPSGCSRAYVETAPDAYAAEEATYLGAAVDGLDPLVYREAREHRDSMAGRSGDRDREASLTESAGGCALSRRPTPMPARRLALAFALVVLLGRLRRKPLV